MAEQFMFEEEEFEGQVSRHTLRRIAGLARPHWRWVVGFLFFIAVVSSLDSLFTYISAQMVDQGIVAGDPVRLRQLATLYAGLIIVQAFSVFAFIYLAGILGERVQYDLRKTMVNHLQGLSFSYFDKTPVGWIMSRVTSDSERIAQLVTWGLLDITWAVLNILTAMFFMFLINWQLALIVLAVIPVLIAVAVYFRRKILVQYRQVRRINSKITGAYNENITGVRVVKALGREDENLHEFNHQRHVPRRLPRRAAVGDVPADGAGHLVHRHRRGHLVRRRRGAQPQRPDGRADHRRHPGVHFLRHLHDVADPGHGARLRRDAELGRIG
ncbi:MAG: ABC transporter transmembrane domain-containing protein [Anaerolineae bacterium]|nr:ABC transporter transmembrane domain-containing protein [Anaerolineae bacterium]